MGRKRNIQAGESALSDEELCRLARRQDGVVDARLVCPSDVETAAWVRLKWRFACDVYGQCLVCPPFTPEPEQTRKVLDANQRAVLIHFDRQADVKAIVADLERSIFLRGWKTFGLGAGPCYFCKTCPVEEGHCRRAERARPAMEACGIDVFSTVRKAGFPIEVVRTERQCPDYYGLILVD